MQGFLYGQTEFNMLKNSIHLDDYIKFAKLNEYSFLTITDSNMHGYLKFYNQCIKDGIKPVIGLEVSLVSIDTLDNNVLLYAYNNEGFHNLLKISSLTKINAKAININELKKINQGICLVTSGNNCDLNRAFNLKNNSDFLERLKTYQAIFEDIYIGISNQEPTIVKENITLYKYLKQNNILALPLHQTLYLKPEDSIVYDALCKIRGDFNRLINQNYCFPSKQLLGNSFNQIPDVFDNLKIFIDKFTHINLKTSSQMPKYPNKQKVESTKYLKALCVKGLYKRLSNRKVDVKVYEQRLSYELEIIKKMNYCDYFLIVWDFIRYAKENEILVGPGRGSAAGSLVAYCLGITNVDPIKYDLLFERFLNPERISMPDIDIDFPDDKRDMVIEYVKEFYGKNNVCSISTFGTFQIRSSLRDIARIFKIADDRIDTIIQMVENAGNFDILLEKMKSNEQIYELLLIASKLEGLPRHTSTHAAGIIINDASLFDIIPIQQGIMNMYQSQLEASDLESLGLLKIDFLGIKNLTIIKNVLSQVPMSINSLNNIPLDDKKTFKLFQKADTLGIFQLESEGVKRVLRDLKPTSFTDVVAVLALYRPGPMENIDEFIKRRSSNKYVLIHDSLKEILKETYGIIVYQEQIMQILLKVANYSLGEADLLRRAISKKDETIILEERQKFILRSIKNGYKEDVAHEIYDLIVKFANYGFNKSHAVAYALVAYQMAYLKANYFSIFIKKMLNNVIGSSSSLSNYINYAKKNKDYANNQKVFVVNPDINHSTLEFENHEIPNTLIFPLQAIFSVGELVARKIIDERNLNGPFESYSNFIKRSPFVNARTLEMLIYSGAFDCFGKYKKELIENKTSNTDIIDKYLGDIVSKDDEYQLDILREKEYKALGMNIKYDIFNNLSNVIKKNNATIFENIKNNSSGNIVVVIKRIKEFTDKNNNQMSFVTLDDGLGNQEIDSVVFANNYLQVKPYLILNQLLLINITKRIDFKNKKDSVIINYVQII